jgi:DNA polymerase-1
MQSDSSFLLIDGHHLFHRTYNALPRSIVGNDGAPIQGVYGFAGAFLRLVRRFEPTHVCVPFDPPAAPFRRELFPEYRTGRPRGTEEEVANFDAQVEQVYKVLDRLGVQYPMVVGYEADDAIGTLACRATAIGLPTTIVSGDRDLLQLLQPLVSMFMPKGQEGELWAPELLQERWGVRPEQFPDLKALIGDQSDHIPGVPGIGPRTAAALLTRHGTIDGIYEAITELPAKQAAALEANRERVTLNRRLVRIVTDLDLPADLETYRYAPGDTPWTASTLLAVEGLRGR